MLDTREQPHRPDKTKQSGQLRRTLKGADLRWASNEAAIEAMKRALKTGQLRGLDLGEYHSEADAILDGWQGRLQGCGLQLWLTFCLNDGHSAISMQCCRVPVCAWDQRRDAVRWKSRANGLMQALPSGQRWRKTRLELLRRGVKPQLLRADIDTSAVMGWRMISLGLRDTGNLIEDIRRTIGDPHGGDRGLRAKLMRFLTGHCGAAAAYVALDVGAEHGHVHLHALVYSPFISRAQLQHWLQSQDCDVPGCKHVAGDRNCHGSWDVDVRKAYSPDEALKYTISPEEHGDPEALADLRVAVYLATYKRHRVETYGLAKPGAVAVVDAAEQRELDEHDGKRCPHCGGPMTAMYVGMRMPGGHYVWHLRPPDRATGPPS